jgi:hypothetical protein
VVAVWSAMVGRNHTGSKAMVAAHLPAASSPHASAPPPSWHQRYSQLQGPQQQLPPPQAGQVAKGGAASAAAAVALGRQGSSSDWSSGGLQGAGWSRASVPLSPLHEGTEGEGSSSLGIVDDGGSSDDNDAPVVMTRAQLEAQVRGAASANPAIGLLRR